MRTLTEQATAVANRDVSPVELTEEALTAAGRAQPALNAFTTLLEDQARDHAKRAEGTEPRGPLHGVPVVVKDLYDVAGIRTTGCCAAYTDQRPADRDSAVVERLREAGAVIVAKTNQHELALGTTTQLSSAGPAANPWDTDRMPGGSSGGSAAAVAARVVLAAMGSDTGGSIRVPASFCGITGLKPTHGAVSLRGAMPLAPSMDTGGPLAISAEDCLLVHRALTGPDTEYLWSVDARPLPAPEHVQGLRIGVPQPFFELLDPDTKAAVEAAARVFEDLGCEVRRTEGPDPEGTRERFAPMLIAEAAHHFRHLEGDNRVLEPTAQLLDIGRGLSASDYVAAREGALDLRRHFESALGEVDALLTPSTAFPAPRRDAGEIDVEGGTLPAHAAGATRFTLLVNATGLPALAFPVGFTRDDLPLGAQLIGPAWSEELLCALGAAYQHVTDWHLRQSPSPER